MYYFIVFYMNNLSQNWQKSMACVLMLCGMSFSILMLCLAASSIKNAFFGKKYGTRGMLLSRQYDEKQGSNQGQNANDLKNSGFKDGSDFKYKNSNRYPKYESGR